MRIVSSVQFAKAALPASMVFALCFGISAVNGWAQSTGCPVQPAAPATVAAQKGAHDQQMAQLRADPAVQAQIAKARADFAAAEASPDLAAQRAKFQQQMAQLQTDPVVQAQIAKARADMAAALASPELAAQRAKFQQQMAQLQSDPNVKAQQQQFQAAMNEKRSTAGIPVQNSAGAPPKAADSRSPCPAK